MTVTDFAFLIGNEYVHELSGAYACAPCSKTEAVKLGEFLCFFFLFFLEKSHCSTYAARNVLI